MGLMTSPFPRIHVLGVTVDLLTLEDLQTEVVRGVEAHRPYIIANHNLHSVYLFHHIPRFQEFYRRADRIHIDGMPLVWLARLKGYPARREHRVTYADWIHPLMALATSRGFRVFHLGGKPGVGEKAATLLALKYPGLQIQTHHGYFDLKGKENERVLDLIHTFRPHILMVGMGMPRQELWILDNLDHLPPSVILPSGACMDYVAGVVPTPPRWAGKVGLEWFFRLLAEPRRLWRRYVVEPLALLPLILRDLHHRSP